MKIVETRILSLSRRECSIAYNKALKAAEATTKYCTNFGTISHELIGIQKLLEQGYQPVILPLFLNL